MGVHMLPLSAHKLGVGALIVDAAVPCSRCCAVAGRSARRSENLLGIAGFGAAAARACTPRCRPADLLRDRWSAPRGVRRYSGRQRRGCPTPRASPCRELSQRRK
ncbi:MAG: hypothetical protein U1E35_06760 [Rhodospirillales bacterium]